MTTGSLLLIAFALIVYLCDSTHRGHRVDEERSIVIRCRTCFGSGEDVTYDFVGFREGKTLRRCPNGHEDLRDPADTCPFCRGHLAPDHDVPDGASTTTYLSIKTCTGECKRSTVLRKLRSLRPAGTPDRSRATA